MSTSFPQIVLDASIALKWLFSDEDHISLAHSILYDFQSGRINLLAPDHLNHEVLNALRTGVRRQRITMSDARDAMHDFLALDIPVVPGQNLYASAFEFAMTYDCAYYDAVYLVLADSERCPFVHADRRLRNTLAGRFSRECWIEEYS